jgi:hypothetical protein
VKPLRPVLLSLAGALALSVPGCNRGMPPDNSTPSGLTVSEADTSLDLQRIPESVLAEAFSNKTSNLQVLVRGKVSRFLADDTEGDKHQRMIVELENGQTLLVAHNIDLAPRVPEAALGHVVYLYGEYEWNEEGGVVHWTHKDPSHSHVDGWIQWQGARFE